jgi:phospholipid/cholesterol/gamma-HCH transport system substrate-binding protein
MRRSVREAIVGLSLLAAISSGLAFWFWLKGIALGQRTWTLRVRLDDAAGLAERSPVRFRGVMVGSVRRIQTASDAITADLEITEPQLRLAQPVLARVEASSLLGGDAQVSLISRGGGLPADTPGPLARGCRSTLIACDRSAIAGEAAPTLSSVTDLMQKMLAEADQNQLVPTMAKATRSFDATSQEARQFIVRAQGLVDQLNAAVGKADPILVNLNKATAEAAVASRHVRNLAAAFDNPRTIAELKTTVSNAEKLSARLDAVGGDVNKLTADPQFMEGVRSVTVGLGRFFEELYPAETGAARVKAQRERSRLIQPTPIRPR